MVDEAEYVAYSSAEVQEKVRGAGRWKVVTSQGRVCSLLTGQAI